MSHDPTHSIDCWGQHPECAQRRCESLDAALCAAVEAERVAAIKIADLERQLEEAKGELDALPEMGTALQELGAKLSRKLDEDDWNGAAPFLEAARVERQCMQSQLRAAQEQVLALREALIFNMPHPINDPTCKYEFAILESEHDRYRSATEALSKTAAIAQQTVQRIEREAVEKLGCGIQAIAAERQRQMEVEGWTPEHDDEHDDGELAHAGASYALGGVSHWPWDLNWWKPSTPLRNLEKAGALIAAEIDRLARAAILGEKEKG